MTWWVDVEGLPSLTIKSTLWTVDGEIFLRNIYDRNLLGPQSTQPGKKPSMKSVSCRNSRRKSCLKWSELVAIVFIIFTFRRLSRKFRLNNVWIRYQCFDSLMETVSMLRLRPWNRTVSTWWIRNVSNRLKWIFRHRNFLLSPFSRDHSSKTALYNLKLIYSMKLFICFLFSTS